MYCPQCNSEYREGFTRCVDCDLPLVEDLERIEEKQPDRSASRPSVGPMLDYCGFFTIQEARQARDVLRQQRVRSEITIREAPDSNLEEPPREEYWLRVGRGDWQTAVSVVGHDETTEAVESEDAKAALTTEPCPSCGQPVAAAESFCPGCGAAFRRRG